MEGVMLKSEEARVVELWPGVSRKTLAGGRRMLLAEITLKKGATVPAHTHSNEQIGYLAKGRFEMRIGDRKFLLKAGDSYVIPANVEHEVSMLEDCVAIDIFSPPRKEWEKDLEG